MKLSRLNTQLKTGNWNFKLDNEGNIIKGSFKDKIRSYVDTKFRNERYNTIASYLATKMDKLETSTPQAMQYHKVMIGARRFRKRVPSKAFRSSESCKKLAKQEFLKRLGISEEAVNNPLNEGFYKWASQTRVDCSMAYFNHTLTSTDQGELQFNLGDGREIKWSDVKEKAAESLIKGAELKDSYRTEYYDKDGVVFRDRFTFSEPIVHKMEEPTGRYLFRINIYAKKPGMTKNHLWWQYVTPDGKVYTFSKYRPRNTGMSCARLGGNLAHNEIAPVWANYKPHNTVELEISKEQFDQQMKFEMDLANSDTPIPFHNFYDNCAAEAKRRLEQLGVNNAPDIRVSFWRVFAPKWIVKPCLKVNAKLPKKVSRYAQKTINVAGNVTSLIYKGYKVDPRFKAKNGKKVMDPRDPSKPIEAHVGSFKHIFEPDRHLFTSPYFVSKGLLDPVHEWRKETKERYAANGATEQELKDIDYQFPPTWIKTNPVASAVQ